MNSADQTRLLDSLVGLAPTNPERLKRLKDLLSKPKDAELLQLDAASIAWLIDIMIKAEQPETKFEVVVKASGPYQNRLGTRFPTESIDAEEGLDADYWGV